MNVSMFVLNLHLPEILLRNYTVMHLTPYLVSLFVFSGIAFSRRATVAVSVRWGHLAAILNFSTYSI